ncbi:hypothetical protein [Nostoc sp.]|uniref:hypothetical protein n=1 Tax=Nostoc sp. TaxID=1180 RepID=UPI002FF9179E
MSSSPIDGICPTGNIKTIALPVRQRVARIHPTGVSSQFRPNNRGTVVYRLLKILIRMQMSTGGVLSIHVNPEDNR